MFASKFLRLALASTALAGVFAASPAAAQAVAAAPARASVDGNGVDLFLGTFNVDGPTLSAGSGAQGLAWRKSNRGGGWGDNMVATLTISSSTAYAAFGGTTDQFAISGSTYTSTEGDGATLTLSGGLYTYTSADGTVAHFTTYKVGAYPYAGVAAIVTDIARPTGETLTFGYDSASYCSKTKPDSSGDICITHSTAYRVATATSSALYRLAFSYDNWAGLAFPDDEVPDTATFQKWGDITGASMSNAAISGSSVRSQSFAPSTSGGASYFTITDPMSRATVYRMSGAAVAGIKLPGSSGEDATVTYSSGKVSAITTAVGTTTYAYADTSGVRTVTVTNPAGKATSYTFDIASQRMTAMTDATSRTTSWQYDTSGRVTRTTAPEGNYTQLTYNGRGGVTATRIVAKSGSGVADIVTTANYSIGCINNPTCNQPNYATDARGNTTNYTYDSATGQLLTVTAPAPTTGATRPKNTYTYTTVNGASMLSTSSVCRSTASCAGGADETKTTITYNANGLPATTTTKSGDDALSATTAIGYDDVGNVTSVDGPMSGSDDTVTWRYDADRERVGAIGPDPDGAGTGLDRAAVKTTYNARGIATVTEIGTVTGTSDSNWAAFSSSQQVTATLDAAGRTTRSVVTAGGTTYGVTEYSYDSVGRPDCVAVRMNPSSWGTATAACTGTTAGADGPDRIARTAYDDAGRVLTRTTAYGISGTASTETLSYTDNGQVESVVDAENNRTSYKYDGADRLLKTKYPSTTKGAGTVSSSDYETLTYDANSNVTARRLRDATTIYYAYDALNRLTYKDLPGSEADVAYVYDLTGRPTTIIDSNSNYVGYAWDALGRATAQSSPLGVVGMGYDAAGRRTLTVYPDSFYVTYSYDTAGNLLTIKESGTTALATYTYDSLGRRTSLTRGNGVTSAYSYDSVSRLSGLALDLAGGTTDDLTLGYTYNPASQIAKTTRNNDTYSWTGAVNVNRGYTSNGLNQFTAAGSVTTFGFDARGNLTSDVSTDPLHPYSYSYTYSSENLLLTGPGSAALAYDPLLRLYQSASATTTTTRFGYDGLNMIGEYNTSGTQLKRYVFGPGSDEVLVEYDGSGNKTYLIADERGSILARTNASGAATAKNTYDEYGLPGSNTGRFGYTGQAWLPEIGMQNSKARMFSPKLGRFLQTDPIGYGDGLNWYNYVKSDPVNRRDPRGLCETTIGGITYTWHFANGSSSCNASSAALAAALNNYNGYINVIGSSLGGGSIGGSLGSGSPNGAGLVGVGGIGGVGGGDPSHFYLIPASMVTSGPTRCTLAQVQAILNYYAIPGADGPKNSGQIYLAYAPLFTIFGIQADLRLGHVTFQVYNGGSLIINTTLGDHLMRQGSVSMKIDGSQQDGFTISGAGTGTNTSDTMAAANEEFGPGAFEKQIDKMKKALAQCN